MWSVQSLLILNSHRGIPSSLINPCYAFNLNRQMPCICLPPPRNPSLMTFKDISTSSILSNIISKLRFSYPHMIYILALALQCGHLPYACTILYSFFTSTMPTGDTTTSTWPPPLPVVIFDLTAVSHSITHPNFSTHDLMNKHTHTHSLLISYTYA